MSQLNIETMRNYLSNSISSINQNKIRGMLAEIDLRNTLQNLGYGNRISPGGWIVRNTGPGTFGHHASVIFPQTIQPANIYSPNTALAEPPISLHTICSTMHQIGVHSFYCTPTIEIENNANSITWYAKQLGIPNIQEYIPLTQAIENFSHRNRNYNFLRYHTDSNMIPAASIPEEFTKEHLRISF